MTESHQIFDTDSSAIVQGERENGKENDLRVKVRWEERGEEEEAMRESKCNDQVNQWSHIVHVSKGEKSHFSKP